MTDTHTDTPTPQGPAPMSDKQVSALLNPDEDESGPSFPDNLPGDADDLSMYEAGLERKKDESGADALGRLWYVIDTNATKGPRVHGVTKDKNYALKADEATAMPQQHALVFLSDTAFKVFNEDRQLVPSMPANAIERAGTVGFGLEPGETVAQLHELTRDALMARAVRYPGGERLTPETPSASIISFVKEAQKSKKVMISDAEISDDGSEVSGSLPDDAVKDMLSGATEV